MKDCDRYKSIEDLMNSVDIFQYIKAGFPWEGKAFWALLDDKWGEELNRFFNHKNYEK